MTDITDEAYLDEEIVYDTSLNRLRSSQNINLENNDINSSLNNNSLENTGNSVSDTEEIEHTMNTPSCSICLRHYNGGSRMSMVLTNCGHSVCNECLPRIDSCPICRNEIEDTVINWAINSEVNKKAVNKIDPFYKIFIDLKRDIENDYLRYPDTIEDTDYESLSQSQMRLINKIKIRLKDVPIKDHMLDNLLIPLWIKYKIKQTIADIKTYHYRLVYFGLENIQDQLPFCP